MKKNLILASILFISVSVLPSCSKHHIPVSPGSVETSIPAVDITATHAALQTATMAVQQTATVAVTLTYVATAGQTAQAVATQTAGIQQTATTVAGAQLTALVQLTNIAQTATIIGTATPTINKTATEIAIISTEVEGATLTFIATAGATVQAAATATVVAQKTAKALQTVVVVTPSITETPTITYTPSITPTITPIGTLPPMPISIYADVSIDDYMYGPSCSSSINVYDANYSKISNASVKVRDITKGIGGNALFDSRWSTYNYNFDSSSINAGDNFEVDVYFNGLTYTAQVIMPGNVQINAAGNVISWQNSDSAYIDVYDPGSNDIYSQNVTGTSVDISSAYSLSALFGTYQTDVSITNSSTFTGGTLGSNQLSAYYYTGWTVDILPGSKSVEPTPTPAPPITSITISAFLNEMDIEGGITQQNNVSVSDMNGNMITNAEVVIKNLSNATQVNAIYNYSNSDYETTANIVYAPGNLYEADVTVDGILYTAQVTAPVASGNLSADCNTVSWNSNGNFNRIIFSGPSSSIYQDLAGNSMDISSYYTVGGEYSLTLMLFNAYSNGAEYPYGLPMRAGIFAGASINSYFVVGYESAWDIEVTP
jgi:hypothetical protein